MGSTRRHFTDEYKASAVALVLQDRKSIAETARNIGVHEMTLGKWVKKAGENILPPHRIHPVPAKPMAIGVGHRDLRIGVPRTLALSL